jgi:hypothetical protein
LAGLPAPAAKQAAAGPGSPYERLLSVCRLMALEPWAEMVGAPMGPEFLEFCERIDRESEALYREVVHDALPPSWAMKRAPRFHPRVGRVVRGPALDGGA